MARSLREELKVLDLGLSTKFYFWNFSKQLVLLLLVVVVLTSTFYYFKINNSFEISWYSTHKDSGVLFRKQPKQFYLLIYLFMNLITVHDI